MGPYLLPRDLDYGPLCLARKCPATCQKGLRAPVKGVLALIGSRF